MSIGASLVAVGQNLSGPDKVPGVSESQLNLRADLEIEMPLGEFKDPGTEGLLFTHFRLGQGDGIAPASSTFTGALNSTAFRLNGAPTDDSTALLAQMWYQVSGNVNASATGDAFDRVSLTVGKIDPFVFFDNNAVADDESESFVNNVFVHNPQLDSGGDIGADSYGFSPGVVAAYNFDANNTNSWTAQLGLFGSGNGANFENSLSRPFSIAQLQYSGRALNRLPGTYQVYTWNNPQSENALTGNTESHSGWGLSLSQQVSRNNTAFARIGHQMDGTVNFDSSLTIGLETSGTAWGRKQDRLGMALGALFASTEYKQATPGAGDQELNAEVFYTYQINEQLHVSPHLIYVNEPGALSSEDDITVLGLRTKASF